MNDNVLPQITDHLKPTEVPVEASKEVSSELDQAISYELAEKPVVMVE